MGDHHNIITNKNNNQWAGFHAHLSGNGDEAGCICVVPFLFTVVKNIFNKTEKEMEN